MLEVQQNISLAPKTTMRIGGKARYYAELKTKSDVEEAHEFAKKNLFPLIVLGGGSNTIFDDGLIEALVVRITAQEVKCEMPARPSRSDGRNAKCEVYVDAGKNLAQLINELAEQSLDLSPLTGILGTVGGAVFGNAGQGHGGVWTDSYIKTVEVFIGEEWKMFKKQDLEFRYRWSSFKQMHSPIIWSATLNIPPRPKEEVKTEITRLLQRRIETQPHIRTAGSCFLSLPDGTPAWKVISAAGLRGKHAGTVGISEKHANFLIAGRGATFKDAKTLVEDIQQSVDRPLIVEMRFIGKEGKPVL